MPAWMSRHHSQERCKCLTLCGSVLNYALCLSHCWWLHPSEFYLLQKTTNCLNCVDLNVRKQEKACCSTLYDKNKVKSTDSTCVQQLRWSFLYRCRIRSRRLWGQITDTGGDMWCLSSCCWEPLWAFSSLSTGTLLAIATRVPLEDVACRRTWLSSYLLHKVAFTICPHNLQTITTMRWTPYHILGWA